MYKAEGFRYREVPHNLCQGVSDIHFLGLFKGIGDGHFLRDIS